MTNEPRGVPWRPLLIAVVALVLAAGCSKDSSDTDEPDSGDSDTGTGVLDTDSWLDEYSMPFDVEPIQWANVPGGLDQPTEATFASKVLLVMFFQKW